jgi:uncharacterized membrane protein
MNLIRFYRLAGAVFLGMTLVTAWGIARVGLDATVPVHWNAAGEPDGYGSALASFVLVPLITIGLVALLAVVPRIEPRRSNLVRSAGAYEAVAGALVLLMLVVQVGIVLAGTGNAVPVGALIGGAVGLLFAVIGNVMTRVRSNFMFGIRTPWTLSSDLAWDRTHRLVGRLWVVVGLAMAALALTGAVLVVVAVMLGFTIVTLVVAVVFSYRVWEGDPDRRPTGGGS